MTELLNCPFCGGEAELVETRSGIILYYVCCKNPDCFAGAVEVKSFEKERLIEAWNTRAERTTQLSIGYVDSREKWFECTECGLTAFALKGDTTFFDYGYCPGCGAKVVE